MTSEPRGPAPILIRDARFRKHVANSVHPERPERLDAIDLALRSFEGPLQTIEPRPATDEEILHAHGRDHLERLRALSGQSARLDPDTYSAPHSFEVARLAAGATIDLAAAVACGAAPNGFALIRPPGHHAEPDRAMGFCLLNQVAIAAQTLRTEHGLQRIAILDWDVHHGNGTQARFWDDPNLLYLSLHQYPLYPGTGALGEVGSSRAEGATVNLPLPAGCGDAEYGAVFREVVVPVLFEFAPEFILVSAGFDAEARDPLASMRMSPEGFRQMAEQLLQVADEVCGGRVALALEGGYDLEALGECVCEVTRALSRGGIPPRPPPEGSSTPRSRDLVADFREAHGGYWKALR